MKRLAVPHRKYVSSWRSLLLAFALLVSVGALAQGSQSINLGWMMRLIFGESLTIEVREAARVLTVKEVPGAQDRIDQIVEDVFMTSTGLFLCGEVLQGEPELIQFHVGVSAEAAKRIASRCQGNVKPSPNSIQSNSRYQGLPRAYLFLLHGSDDSRFDSWTLNTNQTFLMYRNREELEADLEANRPHLRDVLVHELAVYFDRKSLVLRHVIEGFDPNQVVMPEPRCVVQTALNNPLISFAFITIRAFEFEKRIAKELGVSSTATVIPSLLQDQNAGTCLAYVRGFIDQLKPSAPQLAAHSIYIDYCMETPSQAEAGSFYVFGPMDRSSLDDLIKRADRDLEAFDRTIKANGQSGEAYCRSLLEPSLSGRLIRSSQGPRPRITGW